MLMRSFAKFGASDSRNDRVIYRSTRSERICVTGAAMNEDGRNLRIDASGPLWAGSGPYGLAFHIDQLIPNPASKAEAA